MESKWDDKLLELASGGAGLDFIKSQLGEVRLDGGGSMGAISPYFVTKYGFHKSCQIAPFTGDNPATILALPLREGDAMVSLGTSTTFLMNTANYAPDPSTHFFAHPTTQGNYMFMLCYKNGGLAREQIRDQLPPSDDPSNPWKTFEECINNTLPLNQYDGGTPAKIALFFPLPEIVPKVKAGTYRYTVNMNQVTKYTNKDTRDSYGILRPKDWFATDDPRAIVESQVMSLRLRSRALVSPQKDNTLPSQPRRIYLVGGGSSNPAIQRLIGEILGGAEGVFKLDVGGNACALGGAYKAVWACERGEGQTFEDLIGARWRESECVKKVHQGFEMGMWSKYENALGWFSEVERQVLEEQEQENGEK